MIQGSCILCPGLAKISLFCCTVSPIYTSTNWTRGLIRHITSSLSTVLRSEPQYARIVCTSITLMDSCTLERVQSKFATLYVYYGRFFSGMYQNKPMYEVILVTLNHSIPGGAILSWLMNTASAYNREVPSSNLGQDTDYPDWDFFQWCLLISPRNERIVLRNRPRQFPSISFSIHPPLIILPFDIT
jgi:hypothetical protein